MISNIKADLYRTAELPDKMGTTGYLTVSINCKDEKTDGISATDTADGLTSGGCQLTVYTLELPKSENPDEFSRIDAGTYFCRFIRTRSRGLTCQIEGARPHVSPVTDINPHLYISYGNWAGTGDGQHRDTNGGVLLGFSYGTMDGQTAILDSIKATDMFVHFATAQSFMLTIHDIPEDETDDSLEDTDGTATDETNTDTGEVA